MVNTKSTQKPLHSGVVLDSDILGPKIVVLFLVCHSHCLGLDLKLKSSQVNSRDIHAPLETRNLIACKYEFNQQKNTTHESRFNDLTVNTYQFVLDEKNMSADTQTWSRKRHEGWQNDVISCIAVRAW